jgi:hypothetical protein
MPACAKVFKQKSGNLWSNRKHFEAMPGKYVLHSFEFTTIGARQQAALDHIALADVPPCSDGSMLPEVEALIRAATDTEVLRDVIVAHSEFDLPLGASSREVAKATNVLEQLHVACRRYACLKDCHGADKDEAQRLSKLIVQLSNAFYTLVPPAKARARITKMDKVETVDTALSQLHSVHVQNVAAQLLLVGYQARAEGNHPLPAMLRALNCGIGLVPRESDCFRTLEQQMESCGSVKEHKLRIAHILSVARAGEAEAFQPHVTDPNRFLLWHGTDVTNVPGILREGNTRDLTFYCEGRVRT